jgi:hypothetical protein
LQLGLDLLEALPLGLGHGGGDEEEAAKADEGEEDEAARRREGDLRLVEGEGDEEAHAPVDEGGDGEALLRACVGKTSPMKSHGTGPSARLKDATYSTRPASASQPACRCIILNNCEKKREARRC